LPGMVICHGGPLFLPPPRKAIFSKDNDSATMGGLAKDGILAKEGNVTVEGDFAGWLCQGE
jgi:hypothetical protein